MNEYVKEPEFIRGWIKGGLRKITTKVGRADPNEGVELIEDYEHSYHYTIEPYTQMDLGSYVFSVDAKMPTGGRRYMRIKSRTDSCTMDMLFDLYEGVNITTGDLLLQDVYGWYYCEATGEVVDDNPFNIMIMLEKEVGNYDYEGDGTSSIYVDNPSMEYGTPAIDSNIYVVHNGIYVLHDGYQVTKNT